LIISIKDRPLKTLNIKEIIDRIKTFSKIYEVELIIDRPPVYDILPVEYERLFKLSHLLEDLL